MSCTVFGLKCHKWQVTRNPTLCKNVPYKIWSSWKYPKEPLHHNPMWPQQYRRCTRMQMKLSWPSKNQLNTNFLGWLLWFCPKTIISTVVYTYEMLLTCSFNLLFFSLQDINELTKSIYIPRGVNINSLSRTEQWDFEPTGFKVKSSRNVG